jgi:hypothetical protein
VMASVTSFFARLIQVDEQMTRVVDVTFHLSDFTLLEELKNTYDCSRFTL